MTTRTAATIARYFLGLGFTVFGLNGFLHFLPQPPAPPAAMSFAGALFATGYFFPFLKGTEVLVGLALLSNRYVPLALTVLAPIMLNIVAFHLFLAPAGLAIPIVLLAVHLYLAWAYRDAYAAVLRAHVEPAQAPVVRSTTRAVGSAA